MPTAGVTYAGRPAFRPSMRSLLIALLLLATAACGAYRFPGEAATGTGTVSGHVVAVPCSPVAQVQPDCAGRPVAGVQIDFIGGDSTVSTRTNPNGDYSVELAAGTWKVSFKGYMRIISGPASVTVKAGSKAVANYVVDSGIRVPIQPPSTNPLPPKGAPAA